MAPLTDRERQVLSCLVDGLSDKATARKMGVSVHTVRSHLRAIFTKTGLPNRTAVAAWFSKQQAPGEE